MMTKNFSKQNIVLLVVVMVAFLLTNVFGVELARWVWNNWVGKEINWKGVSVQMEDSFFLFPEHEAGFALMGRFEADGDLFPAKDQLVLRLVDAIERDEAFEKLRNWCQTSPNCTEAGIAWDAEKRQEVSCYARSGQMKIWEDREFHIMCSVGAKGAVIEYHGNKENHSYFNAQVSSIMQALLFPRIEETIE